MKTRTPLRGTQTRKSHSDTFGTTAAMEILWTTNLTGLPELTVQNVEQWANMDGNIPRAVLLKGYSNWVEGYIHDVEGKANV